MFISYHYNVHRDPLFRYFHRLNSRTINGRNQGGEHLSETDLFLLFCLLRRIPCNLAHILAQYMHRHYSR